LEKITDVLKLAYFDPVFVEETARSLGVVAEGKGKAKEKVSHLTSKASSACVL
jgi:DNA repair/transcription protein MET18/MMS19